MSDIEKTNFEQILDSNPIGHQKDEKEYEKQFPYIRDNYNDKTEVNKGNKINLDNKLFELFDIEEKCKELVEIFYNEKMVLIYEEEIGYYDLYEQNQREPSREGLIDYLNKSF